jgi:hypothetical protein
MRIEERSLINWRKEKIAPITQNSLKRGMNKIEGIVTIVSKRTITQLLIDNTKKGYNKE